MTKLFPNAMLHWEDFGVTHARRILNKYADQMCTLNDDMQGTAAVVLAAAFAAARAASSRMREQRVVTHGAGTAGIGIADMAADVLVREGLAREEPTLRFCALACEGLITDDRVAALRDFQVPYARPASEVVNWTRPQGTGITLAGVVANSAHHADRHLDAVGRVLRADRQADGVQGRATHHHAAVQPDLEG